MPYAVFEGSKIDYDDILFAGFFDGTRNSAFETIAAITHGFNLRSNFDIDGSGISVIKFFDKKVGEPGWKDDHVITVKRGDVYVVYLDNNDSLICAVIDGEKTDSPEDLVEDWKNYHSCSSACDDCLSACCEDDDDLIDTLKAVFKDSGVKMITIDGDNVKTEVL